MNLDIQQAWCRHWARERLGMSNSDSIVLFIDDARKRSSHQPQNHRRTIQAISTEIRWYFRNPVCVLLSIVDSDYRTTDQFTQPESSMYGIVDQQITVDNATDLCGWLGASNTVFILASDGSNPGLVTPKRTTQPPLIETLVQVAVGFSKPWNLIMSGVQPDWQNDLEWERLHQVHFDSQTQQTPDAHIAFSQAIDMVARSLGTTSNRPGIPNPELSDDYRQAG
jgi:hypothetical protein